jgi:hypothetical protein
MYTVTLIELKAVSAQAKHSDALNKRTSESTAQDDFRDVRDAVISQSQPRRRLNQSQYPQLSSCLQKECQLEKSSRLSELLAWKRRLLEQRTLPKQEAPRKSGRPPPILMTSTTNLIQLRIDLKEHVKG